jgi:hypothetical protein
MRAKYWESIDDFPLFNWMKCNDSELQYTRKDLNFGDDAKDADAWMNLWDQYIRKYGLTKLHERMLKVMKEKAILECEYVISKDRFKLNLIEIEEQRLKDMMANAGEGMKIEESLVHLSKWAGYRLNPKEISVVEYFNILKQYGKENTKKRHK